MVILGEQLVIFLMDGVLCYLYYHKMHNYIITLDLEVGMIQIC